MRKMTQFGLRCGAYLSALLVLCLAVTTAGEAADHPRLVSVAVAKCDTCHADVTRGFRVVHPPVSEDCSSCHDVSVTDGGTTVELSAPEPDLCVICHDGLEAFAAGNIGAPHAPVTDSCLNCHLVHASEHEGLLNASRNELCASCHDIDELMGIHSGQLTADVDCTSCHLPHGSQHERMLAAATLHPPFADGTCDACHAQPFADRIRLRARGERVCAACHGDLSEGAGEHGSVHAALVGTRAKAGCLSCHDPHMSANTTLLNAPGIELCGACHGGVVDNATAESGHAPAAEDCLNCHQPHVSTQPTLLVEMTPGLCVMCHDTDDADLVAAHLGADMAELDCVACHSPHGAGNEHLLAANVHAAILDGCDTCHEGAYDTLMEDGESSLCLACHDDIGEVAEAATVPHPAMEMARCADCHNPHASAQDKLVSQPAGGECTVCHEDQAAGSDEVAHGVIALLGCRVCHEPHGGTNPKLLRVEGSDLCLGCHDSARVKIRNDAESVELMGRFEVEVKVAVASAVLRLSEDGEHGHPIPDHRVLGAPTQDELKRTKTGFNGELTCLVCHDPHKGRSRYLFRGGASSSFELCSTCHQK